MNTLRFLSDEIVVTPELIAACKAACQEPDAVCQPLLARHQQGDWGDVHDNQRVVNDVAATLGKGTIKSVFAVAAVGDICLMTSLNGARQLKPKTYILLDNQHLTL